MDLLIEEKLQEQYSGSMGNMESSDFRGTNSGACCRGRDDILLSAYDIVRIQEHLGVSFKTLTGKYCELLIGSVSGVPLVRIRRREPSGTCPFLTRDKCGIQEAKPTACALFPAVRPMRLLQGTEGKEAPYVVRKVCCGTGEAHTSMKEWVRKCITEYGERCADLWDDMLEVMSRVIPILENPASEETYTLAAEFMYCDYDNAKDFATELESRVKLFREFVRRVQENEGSVIQ